MINFVSRRRRTLFVFDGGMENFAGPKILHSVCFIVCDYYFFYVIIFHIMLYAQIFWEDGGSCDF